MDATDFSRSYMYWTVPPNPNDTRKPGHMGWGNSVRINLEARLEVTDESTGQSDEFFLIAPCRTEWMYRDDVVFQLPSGEYRVVFSRGRHRGLGKRISYEGEASRSGPTDNTYRYLDFEVVKYPVATALKDDVEAVEATWRGLPLVARTEIEDRERRVRAVLEYPIKTMNVHHTRARFQVDTGPVLWPDFASTEEHLIDRLEMAHVGYNRLDRAEFIIRRPTAIEKDGREVARSLHYSDRRSFPARHTLIAAGRLTDGTRRPDQPAAYYEPRPR